jgi:hypothetical protein
LRFFQEKEIPHWFASSVISLIFVANFVIVANLLILIINPKLISEANTYYKYLAIITLAAIMRYVNRKGKYREIINEYEGLQSSKRQLLSYLSILYVLIILIAFFYVGNLVRKYHSLL